MGKMAGAASMVWLERFKKKFDWF